MKKLITTVLSVLALLTVSAAQAAEPIAADKADKILASLKKARPDLTFTEVYESPIKGLYRVGLGRDSIYIAEDGKHFVAGSLLAITDDGIVDPLEAEREAARAKLMKTIDRDSEVVFSPEGEVRAVVHVFTDINCGYCQKLHHQMAEMNKQGIEIRYLAWPRDGLNGDGYRKLATVWCSKDQQDAMNKLKSRQPIAPNVCDDNPVKQHYALGHAMGVSGTPAMFLEDGRQVGGYLEVPTLLKVLGLEPIGAGAAQASQ